MLNDDRNSFYKSKFIEDPSWSSIYPNLDESIRAGTILPYISEIAERHYAKNQTPLRIIDVGCGRGWLTSLLTNYGHVVGIEPIEDVTKYAKALYPNIQFVTATPSSYLEDPTFAPFDLVVCTEVIEHVARERKLEFLNDLSRMITEQGNIIITSPRGELFALWKRLSIPSQPIEDWLTESNLLNLAESCGLIAYKSDRCREFNFYKPAEKLLPQYLLKKVLLYLGYRDTDSMIYQVVWLRKCIS